MRSIQQLGLVAPVLFATVLGVACSSGSTPPPEAAPDTAADEAEDSSAAEDMAEPVPADEPAPEAADSAGEATGAGEQAASADAAASTGGNPLSEGETRTMKEIQKVVLDNRARFRNCYDITQDKEPEVRGDMTIYFVLDSGGRVREAALNEERSTLKHPEIAKCIVGELRKVQFPASSKGLETKVNYPFNFNPK